MRAGILILGIIILVLTFAFSSIISAQEQSQLQLAGSVCNSVIGQVAGAVSGTAAQNCQEVNTLNSLLAIIPIGYLIGGMLFFLGLLIPGKKKEPVHYQSPTPAYVPDYSQRSSESQSSDPLSILKKRYAKGEITKKEFDSMKKDLTDE